MGAPKQTMRTTLTVATHSKTQNPRRHSRYKESRMSKKILWVLGLLFAGCATNSGVAPMGSDTYMITRQAATCSILARNARMAQLNEMDWSLRLLIHISKSRMGSPKDRSTVQQETNSLIRIKSPKGPKPRPLDSFHSVDSPLSAPGRGS